VETPACLQAPEFAAFGGDWSRQRITSFAPYGIAVYKMERLFHETEMEHFAFASDSLLIIHTVAAPGRGLQRDGGPAKMRIESARSGAVDSVGIVYRLHVQSNRIAAYADGSSRQSPGFGTLRGCLTAVPAGIAACDGGTTEQASIAWRIDAATRL